MKINYNLMSRPQKSRKICNPPKMLGFKPFGIAMCKNDHIIMQFDEFEAIKLMNYENLSQTEAAHKMEVSQPTLTRIYSNALAKIANAFVEGRSIIIEGGNYEFNKEWYKCKRCFKLIEGLENHTKCADCDRFGDNELIRLNVLKK